MCGAVENKRHGQPIRIYNLCMDALFLTYQHGKNYIFYLRFDAALAWIVMAFLDDRGIFLVSSLPLSGRYLL